MVFADAESTGSAVTIRDHKIGFGGLLEVFEAVFYAVDSRFPDNLTEQEYSQYKTP